MRPTARTRRVISSSHGSGARAGRGRRPRTAGTRTRRRGRTARSTACRASGSMAPVALASVDEVGRAGRRRCSSGVAQQRRHLGVAPGGDERLEQQRLPVVELLGDEVRADGGEDVGDLALELVLGEELLELVVGLGLDGREQQLGLAAEAAVDGAGGEPGAPGDLLRRRRRRSPSRRTPRRRRRPAGRGSGSPRTAAGSVSARRSVNGQVDRDRASSAGARTRRLRVRHRDRARRGRRRPRPSSIAARAAVDARRRGRRRGRPRPGRRRR